MTREELQNKMKDVLSHMEKVISNLYGRWQEEKGYEDFNDYAVIMDERFSDTFKTYDFITGTKRPFGFKFEMFEMKFQLAICRNRMAIKRVG